MFDIVTFGSAVIDTFVDTELNARTKSYSYPAGSKILVHGMRTFIGGGATNAAVAFARLGFRTGCICKVGKDEEGNRIMSLFREEKIKFLGKCSKERTAHSIILDSKEKVRTVLTFKGCGNDLSYGKIPRFKTKWLYFSSQLKKSLKAQEKLAIRLKSRGVRLAFNPSEYVIQQENITKLLRLTDILIVNKQEAELLVKKCKLKGDLLMNLRGLGPKIVVVTDGNRAVHAFNGVRKYRVVPRKVKVVETTGAGDAFAAGFIAGVMSHKTMDGCLKLGLEESAAVLKHFGAKNNLLRRKLV